MTLFVALMYAGQVNAQMPEELEKYGIVVFLKETVLFRK